MTQNKGSECRRIYLLCQQTSTKRWFEKMNMTSNCDVTKSAHQIQMKIICHWMKPPPWNFFAYATVFHCSLSSVANQIRLKIDFLQLQKLFTAVGIVTAFLSWCWSIYMPGQISNHQFWSCTRSWKYHSHNLITKLLIVIGDCNWLILNHMIAVNAGLQKILQTRLIKNIKWWFCFLLQVFRFVSKNVITIFCSFTPVWRCSSVRAFGAIVS